MQSLTQSILQHTQEVCATLVPIMESTNAGIAYTTSMQLGDYTFTITLNKKSPSSVLGKRSYEGEDPIPTKRPFYTSNQRTEFELPHSDHVLYNNFGHNFSHTAPQPIIHESDMPYIT